MAKAKTAGAKIIRFPAQKAPVVNVRVPGPKHAKKHHRHSNAGKPDMVSAVAAGWIIGYLKKNPGTIPFTIPVIGDTGTIALLAYYFRSKHKMLKTVAVVAAGIAAMEYESEGSITGMEGVAAFG